jgi:hypothetical protein
MGLDGHDYTEVVLQATDYLTMPSKSRGKMNLEFNWGKPTIFGMFG